MVFIIVHSYFEKCDTVSSSEGVCNLLSLDADLFNILHPFEKTTDLFVLQGFWLDRGWLDIVNTGCTGVVSKAPEVSLFFQMSYFVLKASVNLGLGTFSEPLGLWEMNKIGVYLQSQKGNLYRALKETYHSLTMIRLSDYD